LGALEELLKPYTDSRHVYLHRGRAPNVAKFLNSEDLDAFMFVSSASMLSREEIASTQLLTLIFRGHARDLDAYIALELERLESILSALFDFLLPVYEANVSRRASKG
jgi:hypothetical protein